jgi:hypothetical protein
MCLAAAPRHSTQSRKILFIVGVLISGGLGCTSVSPPKAGLLGDAAAGGAVASGGLDGGGGGAGGDAAGLARDGAKGGASLADGPALLDGSGGGGGSSGGGGNDANAGSDANAGDKGGGSDASAGGSAGGIDASSDSGQGGVAATGGSTQLGGSGGSSPGVGGVPAFGGTASGGSTGTGGVSGSGGTASGGSTATGGASASGGTASGGSTGTGGVSGSGGTASGGSTATGGVSASGGTASGGSTATGGVPASGGSGSGGSTHPDAAPDTPQLKGQGATCSLSAECASPYNHCVDGVCCESACNGDCQYCAGTNKGTCTIVSGTPEKSGVTCPSGTSPSCGGYCSGTSQDCTFRGSTTQCATAVCLNSSTLTKAYVCNGSGDCDPPTPATAGCGDYACSNGACKTSCTTNTDCGPSKWCNTGLGTCGGLFYTSVSTKDSHTCAVVVDKTVRCWGINSTGQLGDGTTASRNSPVAVSGLTNVSAVTTGGAQPSDSVPGRGHSCAIQGTYSDVLCWGDNSSDQLGSGDPNTQGGTNPPVSVVDSLGRTLTGVTALAAGVEYTCAISSGYGYCWGRAQEDELGSDPGGTGMLDYASQVPSASGMTTMASGLWQTCGASSSALWCWGDNADYEINSTCSVNCPPTKLTSPTGASSLTAGPDYTCALSAGTVSCWGNLPWSTYGTYSGPTTVSGLQGAQVISAGLTSAFDIIVADPPSNAVRMCGVMANGSVKCFYGGSSTATTVSGISSAKSVTVGRNHACALLNGGTIQCWGANPDGELGNGSNTDSLATPVNVLAP